MNKLLVYGRTTPPCSSCINLKEYLDTKGVGYEYKDISEESNFTEFCQYRLRTVPAVFKDGVHIGGFEKTKELL